jgi:hypothetical protein
LENIESHPEYKKWTVAEGRWQVFSTMQQLFSHIGVIPTSPQSSSTLPITQLLSLSLSTASKEVESLINDHSMHAENKICTFSSQGHLKIHSYNDFLRYLRIKKGLSSSPSPENVSFSPKIAALKSFVSTTEQAEEQIPLHKEVVEASYKDSAYDTTVRWQQAHEIPHAASVGNTARPLSSHSRNSSFVEEKQGPSSYEKAKPVSWTVDVTAAGGSNSVGDDARSIEKNQNDPRAWSTDEGGSNVKLPPPHIRKKMAEMAEKEKEREALDREQKEREQRDRPSTAGRRPSKSNLLVDAHIAAVEPVAAKLLQHQQQQPPVPERVQSKIPVAEHARDGSKPSPAKAAAPTEEQAQQRRAASKQETTVRSPDKAPAAAIASQKLVFTKRLLFQSDCPLRCSTVLTNVPNGAPGSDYVAIGSNAKKIHIIRYDRQKLAKGTDELIDVTQTVCTEQTLENIHKGSVYTMDWLGGASVIASGSNDKMIKIIK